MPTGTVKWLNATKGHVAHESSPRRAPHARRANRMQPGVLRVHAPAMDRHRDMRRLDRAPGSRNRAQRGHLQPRDLLVDQPPRGPLAPRPARSLARPGNRSRNKRPLLRPTTRPSLIAPATPPAGPVASRAFELHRADPHRARRQVQLKVLCLPQRGAGAMELSFVARSFQMLVGVAVCALFLINEAEDRLTHVFSSLPNFLTSSNRQKSSRC